ncbi:ArsC family reductase [Alkalilimnicola sp. S0819]|uniref:ArsC family reductase n=1 Tax=Alkalilimnicola sp. S0819 TaxID=2613922 RepID=UPI001261CEE2|nr:ArsC family reductase [Alkalilimnicola sp. S0819]KAB7627911.1 ArsC family reductase [Alkalilimnicola sp. S0819]MPQ15547.1 ArsC family reductase [Alkalilimnicola sp. S0819]
MTTLYGIKNCDTVRKARRWLDARGVDYRFHDLRADGLSAEQTARWCEACGWEQVLNRRGTTWRQLDGALKATADAANAPALLAEHPTLIKRPVLEHADRIRVGFNEADYSTLFGEDTPPNPPAP